MQSRCLCHAGVRPLRAGGVPFAPARCSLRVFAAYPLSKMAHRPRTTGGLIDLSKSERPNK
jgi:hypothetical protein